MFFEGREALSCSELRGATQTPKCATQALEKYGCNSAELQLSCAELRLSCGSILGAFWADLEEEEEEAAAEAGSSSRQQQQPRKHNSR